MFAATEIRPGVFLIQTTNSSGKVIRGIISLAQADYAQKVFQEEMPEYHSRIISLITPDPSHLAKMLPGINRKVKNPVTGKEQGLFSTIIDLNDGHGWTREKIADWIETLDDTPKFEVK